MTSVGADLLVAIDIHGGAARCEVHGLAEGGKSDGEAGLHGGGLIAPVVGGTTDDDATDPLQDLLLFLRRPAVEVVRQVPGDAPALGG